MCVACKQMRPKRELVRVVRTSSGDVAVDPTGKLSGRGAYVCPTASCVAAGVREGRLQHALEVVVPDSLEAELLRVAAAEAAVRSGADEPRVIRIPSGGRPPRAS